MRECRAVRPGESAILGDDQLDWRTNHYRYSLSGSEAGLRWHITNMTRLMQRPSDGYCSDGDSSHSF